jgi:DNA-binding HxlR family transcriptional regulator
MTARPVAKREILRAIAKHDGEWYWYQLDRAISGVSPDCIGPFTIELNELAAEGLIEIRNTPDLAGGVRYWLTEAGKSLLAAEPES